MMRNNERFKSGRIDDIYSKESELVNKSKRELADGLIKCPIYKLRLHCFARGATGIMELARAFQDEDTLENKYITYDEFVNAIRKVGLECSAEEMNEMFNGFDENGEGSIAFSDFLVKLRPEMHESRLEIIEEAFEKLDKEHKGYITLEHLRRVYNVKDQMKYISGEMSEEEIRKHFTDNFKGGHGCYKDKVTKMDFINYYATLSPTIDNDTCFDLVLRHAFKI